jgi:molybdate transport system substrate-binding protein
VTFSFAASSELVAQIIEGAPADVYASADLTNMTKLTDAGANAGEPVVFATTARRSSSRRQPARNHGVEDLADDLILVTCAPQVPCGAYAAQIFENAGVTVTPDSYEENVKAVVTKVTLGEADAGIAYATDVAAAETTPRASRSRPSSTSSPSTRSPSRAEAPNPDGAQAFVDFVVSDTGQAILSSYGFTSP